MPSVGERQRRPPQLNAPAYEARAVPRRAVAMRDAICSHSNRRSRMMRRLESGAWALFLAMSRALQMGGPRLVTAIAHWAVSVHRSQGRRWLAAGMASLALTVVIM